MLTAKEIRDNLVSQMRNALALIADGGRVYDYPPEWWSSRIKTIECIDFHASHYTDDPLVLLEEGVNYTVYALVGRDLNARRDGVSGVGYVVYADSIVTMRSNNCEAIGLYWSVKELTDKRWFTTEPNAAYQKWRIRKTAKPE